MSHSDDHPLEFFCSSKFSDVQKSRTIVVNASKGEESAVSPTIYKSERRNVAAPDLDGHVVVDNPVNRGVDVKCENAATSIDERFWRGKERFVRLNLHKALLERDARCADGNSGSASNVCLASIRRMRTPARISE